MFDLVPEFITYKECQIHTKVIGALVAESTFSLRIATANIRDFRVKIAGESFFLSEYLKYFAQRGIQIKLLTTPRALTSRLIKNISKTENFEIMACARNHLKVIVADEKKVYVGTANLTSSGLGSKSDTLRNFECGFIFEDKEVIAKIIDLFDGIFARKHCFSCYYRDRKDIGCSKNAAKLSEGTNLFK
jgi:phosphatidylserine/phosphatidylglycerophosphate/cardiolipin synthase-like enzyme